MEKNSKVIEKAFNDRLNKFVEEFELVKELTPDAIHDFRVSNKRLTAICSLISSLSGKKIKTKELKGIMEPTGVLRDYHIHLQLLKDEKDDDFIASFKDMINREIGKNEVLVSQALSDFPIQKVVDRLKKVRFERAGKEEISTILSNRFQDFGSFKESAVNGDMKAFHKMRISLKKFRYTAEVAKPLFSFINKDVLAKMKDLQDVMGDIHDYDVMIERVGSMEIEKLKPFRENYLEKLRKRRGELFNLFLDRVEKVMVIEAFSVLFERDLGEQFSILQARLDEEGGVKVKEALEYAKCVHVAHPLRASLIISNELRIDDSELVVAALLHDTLEEKGTIATLDEIRKRFGDHTADLVWSVTREKDDEGYVEKIRSEGKKAITLKLADRLDSTRHLNSKNSNDREKYWKTTIRDFLPLGKEIDEDVWHFFYTEYKKAWDRCLPEIREKMNFPEE